MIYGFVTVSRTRARVFKKSTLSEKARLVTVYENELGRERNKNLRRHKNSSDRAKAGRSIISFSVGTENDPHEDAAVEFAAKISKKLAKDCKEKGLEKLTIFADPHMKGLLKKHLNKMTLAMVDQWVPKNLNKLDTAEIEELVSDFYPNGKSMRKKGV